MAYSEPWHKDFAKKASSNKKKKSKSVLGPNVKDRIVESLDDFLRFIVFMLIIGAIIVILANNLRDILELIAYFTLFAALYGAFIKFRENKIADSSLILGGAGIFVFTLFTFLLTSSALFLYDGTDSCDNSFPVILDGDNYVVFIGDLKAKNYGDNFASIAFTTTLQNPEIGCENCEQQPYPKKPGEEQQVNVKLTVPTKITAFSFTQTTKQFNQKLPLITSSTNIIRSCQCKVNFNENKLYCQEQS
jgi:hypothetical protein